MIVDKAIYVDGERRRAATSATSSRAARDGSPGNFLWIGLKNPTQAEFDEVNEELQLHPLAVEDAIQGRQRAKVELYENSVFVGAQAAALRGAELGHRDRRADVLRRRPVHRHRAPGRGGAPGRPAPPARGGPARAEAGPMAVLHAIVDSVVDNYTLIDAEVSADLDEIETRSSPGADMDSSTIYRLKREVLEFRRAAAPLAAPLMALHEDESPHVTDRELRLRFRDVSDHLQAVIDHVESYDRLLTDVLGAHLAQVTVQQNTDMRRISAWVAIAAVPTMIAGIYGMNFDYMPELTASLRIGDGEFRYGYFVILAVILASTAALFLFFRRHHWL